MSNDLRVMIIALAADERETNGLSGGHRTHTCTAVFYILQLGQLTTCITSLCRFTHTLRGAARKPVTPRILTEPFTNAADINSYKWQIFVHQ